MFTILVCAGVDLPPGQRESASYITSRHWLAFFGGDADTLLKVRKEKRMLHKLKVKPQDGGTAIFLDEKELRGVRGLVLNMDVRAIPTVYFEMNVDLIDVEADDVCVIHEEKIIGLMVADSPQILIKRFDADQVADLKEMTPQLVLSMLFYKSYNALRNKLRLDQELEVAKHIQSGLLPESHPGWGDFKVCAFTRSAKEVNGDFYDFVEIDDNRLLIVIGDACGKGVPACMLTAMTRSFISSASWRFDNLANFLREINNNLFADTDADKFVSLACCLLDKRNGLLEFGRAGHTDLITFVNNHIRRFNPDGSALGLMPGELAEYDTICLKCSPGSTYMLYSDGINEALNKAGEEFGTTRLVKEFDASSKAGHKPEETLEHILSKVDEFAPEQIDDQTIILVSFAGRGD